MVKLILPIIAGVFIVLAIMQLAAARRAIRRSSDPGQPAIRVPRRLATIFFLVGAGLLGLFWFTAAAPQ